MLGADNNFGEFNISGDTSISDGPRRNMLLMVPIAIVSSPPGPSAASPLGSLDGWLRGVLLPPAPFVGGTVGGPGPAINTSEPEDFF